MPRVHDGVVSTGGPPSTDGSNTITDVDGRDSPLGSTGEPASGTGVEHLDRVQAAAEAALRGSALLTPADVSFAGTVGGGEDRHLLGSTTAKDLE